jgi:hypothetical protein
MEDWLYETVDNTAAQKMAWKASIHDPFNAPVARMPVNLVTGVFPVDRFKVPQITSIATNASDWAFVALEPDAWHGNEFIEPGSASGAPFHTTSASYVGYTSPAVGVSTNVTAVNLPTISSDFVTGTNGSEYMNTSGGMTLSASYSTDGKFAGSVFAVRTSDPGRAPLTGQIIDDILSDAVVPGSAYEVAEFGLTASGRMFLRGSYANGNYVEEELNLTYEPGSAYVDDRHGPYTSIVANLVPGDKRAAEYFRMNGSPVTTIQAPQIAFFIVNVTSGSIFRCRHVMNYVVEKSKDYRAIVNSIASFAMALGQSATSLISEIQSGIAAGHYHPAAQTHAAHFGILSRARSFLEWMWHKLTDDPTTIHNLLTGGGERMAPYIGKMAPKLHSALRRGVKSGQTLQAAVGKQIKNLDGSGTSGFWRQARESEMLPFLAEAARAA